MSTVVGGPPVADGAMTTKRKVDVGPGEWYQVALSADGARAALLGADAHIRTFLADGTADGDFAVRDWGGEVREISWSRDGTRLFGIWATPGAYAILEISMDGSARAVWQTSDAPPSSPTPSPDGAHLAFARARVERNAGPEIGKN